MGQRISDSVFRKARRNTLSEVRIFLNSFETHPVKPGISNPAATGYGNPGYETVSPKYREETNFEKNQAPVSFEKTGAWGTNESGGISNLRPCHQEAQF